ncbi:MAG: glycosyltransferase involved in cell wall biosynthesis [Polaribacter sp.]|jgi:glycosyltransferase involved in cell wall biosynthesis
MQDPKKVNIAFILPTLAAGGAERVISFVAQNINPEKFNPKLLITGYKKDAAYRVENISIEFLEKKRVFSAIFKLFMFLMKYKPDVVVSSIGHLNTVMGLMSPFFPKTKFVIRVATVSSAMSEVHQTNKSLNISDKLRSKMADISFKLIDNVICQSQDMADDFVTIYKVPIEKISIINNPITHIIPLSKTIQTSSEIVKFITVGRLSKEKGYLRILKMLSELKFEFHYTIIGEGPLKDDIFKAIHEYNLNEKIMYIPFTEEVSKYMSSNDLFLQGSYVEGFPNTVLESCYVGTPVIAFNAPGGTKEILIHKENGYLVDTEDEYLHYLNNRLPLSPIDIRNSVETRFNTSKIISQYEALFN